MRGLLGPLTAGTAAEFRRQRVGRIGRNVKRGERHALDADVRFAVGTVDQTGGADDFARMLGQSREPASREERPVVMMSSTHQHARRAGIRVAAAQLEDAALRR